MTMLRKSPLPAAWAVPKVFQERMGEDVGRQRIMQADGHLLVILHQPPKADEMHRQGRLFWRAPDGTWQSNNLGSGIRSIHKHLDEYSEVLQKLEDAEERAGCADDYFPILSALAPLHRSASNMYDTLQEARNAVPDDHDLIVCRDRAYSLHRWADLLQADTKSGLECAVVRRAEEESRASRAMARSAHRLNILAALFFPVATVAAIFGMNVPHGLETADRWLFWALLGGSIMFGLVLTAAIIDRPESETRRHRDDRPGR